MIGGDMLGPEKERIEITERFTIKREDAMEMRAWLERKFGRVPQGLLWLAAYIGGELGMQTELPPEIEGAYLLMISEAIVTSHRIYRAEAKK